MTILNVNYRQFEEYHFVFAQMNAACCIGGQNKKSPYFCYIKKGGHPP
jgi:hypothetical protein